MVNAIQSNNVELDDRGYIYVADRAGTGMRIRETLRETQQKLAPYVLQGASGSRRIRRRLLPHVFIAAANARLQTQRRNAPMKIRAMWLLLIPALLCTLTVAAEPPRSGEAATSDVSLANVAKIEVGTSTTEQIKELLGTPYRMTNYGFCSPMDYRGALGIRGPSCQWHLQNSH